MISLYIEKQLVYFPEVYHQNIPLKVSQCLDMFSKVISKLWSTHK